MKTTTTALVALLAAASTLIPAQADEPKLTLKSPKPAIAFSNSTIEIADLLRIVAKQYGVPILIDSEVRGTMPLMSSFAGTSAKETLEWIAVMANLKVTEKDGSFIIAKAPATYVLVSPQVTSGLKKDIDPANFRLKLRLENQQFPSDGNLMSRLLLDLKPGSPEVDVVWGLQGTLKISIVSLKDNSFVPVREQPVIDRQAMPKYPQWMRGNFNTRVTESFPLRLSFDLSQWLEKPLEPGRYLYFITYQSKPLVRVFGDASPFAGTDLFGATNLFDGEIVSNTVQFEILPEANRFQLLG